MSMDEPRGFGRNIFITNLGILGGHAKRGNDLRICRIRGIDDLAPTQLIEEIYPVSRDLSYVGLLHIGFLRRVD
jgi:hypothetical protein